MEPDNTFLGSYLKVERAKYHIQQLKHHIQPLTPWWFELSWIKAIGLPCSSSYAPVDLAPDSNVVELAFIPKRPIPQFLSIVIGDAIHNLRTALDYAATAVVRKAKGNTAFVTFPFHEDRDQFKNAPPTGLKQLKLALPKSDVTKFFLDDIKPYKGGNTELWMLTKIDKIDKHNFILPVISIGNIFQGMMIVDGPGAQGIRLNARASNDASRPFAFVRVDGSNGLPAYSAAEITANITFPIGEFFSGAEVISTLEKLTTIVTKTLKDFEKFVVSSGLDVSAGPWVDMYENTR